MQYHQCGNTNLIADSGTSIHIISNKSDLSEYEEITEDISLNTASKATKPLKVKGKGAMFLTISENHRGQELMIWLYPVYYVTGSHIDIYLWEPY